MISPGHFLSFLQLLWMKHELSGMQKLTVWDLEAPRKEVVVKAYFSSAGAFVCRGICL